MGRTIPPTVVELVLRGVSVELAESVVRYNEDIAALMGPTKFDAEAAWAIGDAFLRLSEEPA